MSKEEKIAKKLAKKEKKQAKKQAKLDKANAKYQKKADKKHNKAYKKFVKKAEKKNIKLQKKAADSGTEFIPVSIPAVDVYQTKKEAKALKAGKKAYKKYLKKINKKNTKAEKKATKKGKPFVAAPVLTEEEFLNGAVPEKKAGKIILMIILILLIIFLIYFMYAYKNFPYTPREEEESTTASEPGEPAVYPEYSNPHEITTTPTYSIADAKLYLKQSLNDNWSDIGLKSDPSSGAITYSNKIEKINGVDCYVFSCGGNTYAVSIKLSAAYYYHNGEYSPFGFNNTGYFEW